MQRHRTYSERFWEILPGLQFWVVFLGCILLSWKAPVLAALFIICFDLYWVLKAINVAIHLISSYRKFRFYTKLDWLKFANELVNLEKFSAFLKNQSKQYNPGLKRKFYLTEYNRINTLILSGKTGLNLMNFYQLVLIPFVDEDFEVLNSTFKALAQSNYPKERMLLVLACEQRAGQKALDNAQKIQKSYNNIFDKFFITTHPEGLPNEIKGKSANASWAIKQIIPELEKLNISNDQVLVSNFDSDTIVHPEYFARVMYEFLTADKPYRKSFQPIAVYNNNIWDTPAIIRVVSVSNSFWQFTESSRPDRLRTFSSHTMTLKALVDVGFWQKDIVNEDGFIFWQCYIHYKGDYQVIPLFIPISLDTCLAESLWQTLKNQYKQKRRWAYNVEYYPYIIPKLITLKAPFFDKMYKLWQYMEGNFNWATASIMISILGWMPLILGGDNFLNSVVAFNLPIFTRILMNTAMVFLIFSVYINIILLPPRPKYYSPMRSVAMYLQWFLVPIASVIFGSLPAVESQTRLMFGQYLEFWVTPKSRKGENTALDMKEMRHLPRS